MASRLAAIHGTEHDKNNCTFYHKIGACRHGDKCSRKHVKPIFSQTILLPNLYLPPSFLTGQKMSPPELQKTFENFYEDMYCEAALVGPVEEMVVCENDNDHLMGNVYVRFKYEEDAQKAMESFSSRWYGGRPVYAELSPVTDLREACCRQHEEQFCKRGGQCNFIHAKRPPGALRRELEASQRKFLEKSGNLGRDDRDESPDRYVPRR